MFSSIFGKRRSSPVEDDTPPIPGARQDDGFVVVDQTVPGNSLYPSVGGLVPFPQRPAPLPPAPIAQPRPRVDTTFNYLQGVPFTMNKTLQMATNKDVFATETADLLAFLTNRANMGGFDYDFSVEKSVLKEC